MTEIHPMSRTSKSAITRRSMLTGSALIAAAVSGGLVGAPWANAEATGATDPFEQLRSRWIAMMTGSLDSNVSDDDFRAAVERMDDQVDSYLGRIDRSAGRQSVFIDMPLNQRTDQTRITATYTGLRLMALAWATPGAAKYHDPDLLNDTMDGLVTVDAIAYNTTTTKFGNWWDFEIGSPKRLADVLVIIHDQLSAETLARYVAAIRHFVPDPLIRENVPTTGANRTSMCSLAVVEGLASSDSDRVAHAVSGLPDVCAYVTGDTDAGPGEGLWADGSFIQHNLAYTGTYGVTLLGDIALMSQLLAGTTWGLTDPSFQQLYSAIDTGFAPVMHHGRMMNFVTGRKVAIQGEQEHQIGVTTMLAMLRLARGQVTDSATTQRWRGLCQGWLERSGYSPFTAASPSTVGVFKELLTSGLLGLPEQDGSVIYRNMARAVHRREGWAISIAMNTNRIARYESINGENLRGWHAGEGMTCLYNDDNTQYTDGFWPTVDPMRLPGITHDETVIADGASLPMSPWRWAGGASLDSRYSAAGSTHQSATSSLTGKKSWFCFDEVIFCMGRSFSGGNGNVETVVENRNLHADGTNAVLVDGSPWTGTDEVVSNPGWVHVEQVGGFIFPASANPRLRLLRETRSGRWSDISKAPGTDTTLMTRKYVSLALQHGASPSDGLYTYLVVPNATSARTQALSDHRPITVLAHNGTCHAVKEATTGLRMFNFWASPATVDGVTVDRVCSVIVRELTDSLEIAVANPLRDSGAVQVTVTPAGADFRAAAGGIDDRVTVLSTGGTIRLKVDTDNYGKTFVARFIRG